MWTLKSLVALCGAIISLAELINTSSASDMLEPLNEHRVLTGINKRDTFLELDNTTSLEAHTERRSAAGSLNCEGSAICIGANLVFIKDTLRKAVKEGKGNEFFSPGEQIACGADICAFYEAGTGGTVAEALEHVWKLHDHGCKECGSVATSPGGDVKDGRLTVNYVQDYRCVWPEICEPKEDHEERYDAKNRAERRSRRSLAREGSLIE